LASTLFACTEPHIYHEWSPTFDANSTEPFGCKYLDSLLHIIEKKDTNFYYLANPIVDKNPTYIKETFENGEDQIWTELKDSLFEDNITYVNDYFLLNILKDRIEKGYSTIIASESFNKKIKTNTDKIFDFQKFANDFNRKKELDCATIHDEKTGKEYKFPKQFCSKHFTELTDLFTDPRLGEREVIAQIDNDPIAIRYRNENGACVVIVSTPLLFTNYGLLFENNSELITSIINQANISGNLNRYFYREKAIHQQKYSSDYPPSNTSADVDTSFFKDLVKALSIRIAIILGILIFILFLLFSAKRKQRIIPIIQAPHNKTLDFIKQVSKLYFWKQNYTGITKKSIVYFFANIEERLHIRMDDKNHLSDNCTILASIANLQKEKTESFIKRLLSIHSSNAKEISEDEMKTLIDQMDNIIKKLK
jgi:hypothetical protein